MLRTSAILLLATSPAMAEPLSLTLGVGLHDAHQGETRPEHERGLSERDDLAPAISFALGYRLHLDAPVDIAIGGRAAASRVSWTDRQYVSMGSSDEFELVRYPLHLAAAVQVQYGRAWLTPWFGAQMQYSRNTTNGTTMPDWATTPAFGATVGVDILRTMSGNFGVLVDAEKSGDYSALGLGLAYHR